MEQKVKRSKRETDDLTVRKEDWEIGFDANIKYFTTYSKYIYFIENYITEESTAFTIEQIKDPKINIFRKDTVASLLIDYEQKLMLRELLILLKLHKEIPKDFMIKYMS